MIAARRPYSAIFPLVLIVGGGVILLANLGTLPEGAGWRLLQLWPLLLVMLGLQLLVPRLVHGTWVPAVTLLLVGAVALGGFAYAVAGPTFGSATYTRFQSTSPVAGVTEGTLTVGGAAAEITITARDTGTDLYQAKVDYTGDAPRFSYADGNVKITGSSGSNVFNWGRPLDRIDVAINPSVSWAIVIDGVGATTRIDVAAANLRSFRLNGVGGNVTLMAGAPHGVVRVSLDGVGTGLTFQVPVDTEYRVTASGLGTSIGGTTQTAGWASAADRYDVTVAGVGAHATVSAQG